MPVRSATLARALAVTKKITPPDLDPTREWCDILDYLDVGVLRAARQAGIKTITQGSRTREEQDDDAYLDSLFTKQLKGYQLEALPEDVAEDQKQPKEENRQFEQVDGVWRWKFTPANIAKLPPDLRNWLHVEILTCGGIVPTATVVVTTDSGQVLDFRSTDGQLGAAEEPEISAAG